MASRLRPIDLVELRGLCLAVELGSLGRAAAAMGISQPALSKRMRELEASSGVALLQRSTRGVLPTPAGERLYREARSLLAHAETVGATLDALRGERPGVRLAASHTIAEYLLPEPLAAYRSRPGPGVALELVAANSAVVHELVRERRVDLGAAAVGLQAPHPELVVRPVCTDEVVVAVCADHPWAARGTIALDELLATSMVMRDPSANTRQVLDAALDERGLRAAVPLAEVGSTAAAISSAVSEGVPAVLSARAVAATPALAAVDVDGLALRRTFALVRRADVTPTTEQRELESYLAAALS